jgi:hypothetical protein
MMAIKVLFNIIADPKSIRGNEEDSDIVICVRFLFRLYTDLKALGLGAVQGHRQH